MMFSPDKQRITEGGDNTFTCKISGDIGTKSMRRRGKSGAFPLINREKQGGKWGEKAQKQVKSSPPKNNQNNIVG